jgi:eukaryotic-like serine/threonine-protein kinase
MRNDVPAITKRALEIIDSALEVEPVLRWAYISRECPDSALRDYIWSLLSSYAQVGDFLNESALVSHADDWEQEADSFLPGRRIGAYQLMEELGEGGMGVVFRAERDDNQYHKVVAIKLLRSSFDMGSMLARFKAERQILASLEHPNIARLLDGGATPEAHPIL